MAEKRNRDFRINISRIRLKKEVKEMNAAFIEEMNEIEENEQQLKDLEDVYYSDEDDLVCNAHSKPSPEDSEAVDLEEEEEPTVEEILK